jgi:hypothetical protein
MGNVSDESLQLPITLLNTTVRNSVAQIYAPATGSQPVNVYAPNSVYPGIVAGSDGIYYINVVLTGTAAEDVTGRIVISAIGGGETVLAEEIVAVDGKRMLTYTGFVPSNALIIPRLTVSKLERDVVLGRRPYMTRIPYETKTQQTVSNMMEDDRELSFEVCIANLVAQIQQT